MGTNASTKKVASKIVAVLLAALMLISVLPMTAFAASVEARFVVEGLTLISGPEEITYYAGEKIDFNGMQLEVTYRSISEIAVKGDKAERGTVVINGYDKELFTKYGIGCNYKVDQKLTLADNLVPLKFTYGPNSTLSLETDCYLAVFPTDWTMGDQILGFYVGEGVQANGLDYADGQYILVANGDMVLTSALVGETTVGSYLAQNCVAVVDGLEIVGESIPDLEAQLSKLGINLNDATWMPANDKVEADVDDPATKEDESSEYVLRWLSSDKNYFDFSDAKENNAIREGEWPLGLTGKNMDTVNLTSVEDGKMYIEVDVEGDSYIDINGNKVENTELVKLYVAVNETAGYAYLTADASKAATISVYRVVTAKVNDIEIAKEPTKMSYIEGEKFDASGMIVNLMYNDTVVLCVPFELFDVYGIEVWPYGGDLDRDCENADVLTVKEHNNNCIWVYYDKYSDDSDNKLKVADKADAQYILADGRLADGKYVIAWITDTMKANVVYNASALSSKVIDMDRATFNLDGSNYNVGTTSVAPIEVYNNEIGRYNNSFFAGSGVSDEMVWTVKYDNNERAYTIQDSEGKYLTRNTLTYKDLWVFNINTTDSAADALIANVKNLVLTDAASADSYWLIDGSADASIQSYGDSKADNFYLTVAAPVALALDVTAIQDSSASVDFEKELDQFYFFKTTALDVINISIVDQPNGVYTSGAALDLGDMVAMITYANGATVLVGYDEFAAYGIKVNYANGAILGASDNGKNIVISLGDLTSTGTALKVTDSKAEVKVDRLSGADRYATAAAIATEYVETLGADYTKAAVLASGVNYPDALAGATLAAALKAPIVLTKTDALVAATESFLKDNAVKTVYILGGASAINADVEAALKALNINVIRISGTDRVETSIAVAQQLATAKGGYADTVVLTNGANFADALSVSSAAAAKGLPVIYVNGTLTENVKNFITTSGATKAVILGGEAAVSASVEADVKAMGLAVDRVKGADRWETSVAIAEYFADCYTGKAVAFATGKDFPDALAGGVYASYVGAPVVLLDNGYANADAALYTAGLELTNVYVFGGVEALSDATIDAALLK